MGRTLIEILIDSTDTYMQSGPNANPVKASIELLHICEVNISLENLLRTNDAKYRIPMRLYPVQIAKLMSAQRHIVRICTGDLSSDAGMDLLAVYCTSGQNEGLYVTDEDEFGRIATEYNYIISSNEISEVMRILRQNARRVQRTMDRNLVAVNNGVFCYDTKTLEPFSPEYVFLSKSRVDYNPDATNQVIHNDEDGTDWDVESWIMELSDDLDVADLIWQILGAIIRPNVRWNKSAWFYSVTGNNGKGTLCELMRSLCGPGSYAAIPLCDFGKDFVLEPLVHATAIIVDENDVGTYIDRAANVKAVITNDVIYINRKHKTPISYQFYGFMVQCLNEFPRIRDKSDSFYRRQLFIPFDKCFTGRERKYIKEDYLHRKEVLEYVMFRVLNMNYYTLSEPDACREVLDEYKEFNDPVRQFLQEMLPQLVWDLVPYTFLYDLYKTWHKQNNPSGSIQGRNVFIRDVVATLSPASGWQVTKQSVRSAGRMDAHEPLIIKYCLGEWTDPEYRGDNEHRIANFKRKDSYRGLVRVSTSSADTAVD